MTDLARDLAAFALSLPGATESIACAGTSLEQASYTTTGKAFLFVQRKAESLVLRMKLAASLADVEHECSAARAGVHGWVTFTLPPDSPLSDDLKRWVQESRGALAAKPVRIGRG